MRQHASRDPYPHFTDWDLKPGKKANMLRPHNEEEPGSPQFQGTSEQRIRKAFLSLHCFCHESNAHSFWIQNILVVLNFLIWQAMKEQSLSRESTHIFCFFSFKKPPLKRLRIPEKGQSRVYILPLVHNIMLRACLHAQSFSHAWLFVTLWTITRQAPLSMEFPGKNTGVGCHFLLQRIFQT